MQLLSIDEAANESSNSERFDCIDSAPDNSMSVAETAAVDQGDSVCEENLTTRTPRRQSATVGRCL